MKHGAQTAVRPVISVYAVHSRRPLKGCGNPCQRFIIDRQALLLRAQLWWSHPVVQAELPDEGPDMSGGVVDPEFLLYQFLNIAVSPEFGFIAVRHGAAFQYPP